MSETGKLRPPTAQESIQIAKALEATKFERGAATGPLHWGLTVLHNELASSAKLYSNDDKQAKRDAIVCSIFAVQRFLNSQGINGATIEPLMHIVTSLVERENNRLDPIFCERVREGKPSRALAEFDRIAAIATLANAYLEAHSDETGKVSEKLKRFARQAKCDWLGQLTYSKVKAAREMIAQEDKDHPARTWAALYLDHFADFKQRSNSLIEAYQLFLGFFQRSNVPKD